MRTAIKALLLILVLLSAGCAGNGGNREFLPGLGWTPVAAGWLR